MFLVLGAVLRYCGGGGGQSEVEEFEGVNTLLRKRLIDKHAFRVRFLI